MDKLLPCPFCGQMPKAEWGESIDGFAKYYIECECYANPMVSDQNSISAIELWNRRVPVDPANKALEQTR